MQIRSLRAGAAVAALASAALVGAAPLASAAPRTVEASSCQITAQLTGLAGRTLVAGGAPLSGHVAFTNVSGKALSTFAELLTAGSERGGPSTTLKIQAEHGGKWITMPYSLGAGLIGFHIASPGDNHLAAGNVDAAPLLVSVPKGTPAGTYVLVATSAGANVGPSVAGRATQGVPTQFSGCHSGISISAAMFKVVAAGKGTPSASATPSAAASTSAPAAVPSASPSSKLAETGGGSNTGPIAGAAAALIALGAGALVVTRRRRGGQHS
ncbi:LAETG motif-containing sortase-dependent surface protein [Streptacidiphilus jiangxiensis]|uniref:LPXTG-motif cell wall anchor domain-containing protein n=1 Tax=Streptacidiphilus jiangxiensis TaxID=235985 RepID=A0A1H7JHE3_STRJI|nr:LAETG motif-containing sortase-dependent surface protein [Streptacidiphilus jiangxiensis]SEK74088.1 LPXTG-motif cell wall anchor domain-containing protein [Streptacidiphilus jiangxiensis]